MITVTNLHWPDRPFQRTDRAFGRSRAILTSFDVEWTKNYRVKNGNVPFCYSFVYLVLPDADTLLQEDQVEFGFKSVYAEKIEETQPLIQATDADLGQALQHARVITGHQLSSDLSVLVNAAQSEPPNIVAAREAWHARKTETRSSPRIFDTRYDMEQFFSCASRRLVDVCADLALQVQQPEIKGSMTAMHRTYLSNGNEELRERIAVLNIRHSLSQGLLALYGTGHCTLPDRINVNRVMQANMWDCFAYMNSSTFLSTLEPAAG